MSREKKCFSSHREVAHKWVNGRVSGLYTPQERVSTTSDYFYSYSTKIAMFVTNTKGNEALIIDNYNYSNTTIKHQQSLWSASNHLTRLETHIEVFADCEENMKYYLKEMEKGIKTLSKARSSNEGYYIYDNAYTHYKEWRDFYSNTNEVLADELFAITGTFDVIKAEFDKRRDISEVKKEAKRVVFVAKRLEVIKHFQPRIELYIADKPKKWRQHLICLLQDYFNEAEIKLLNKYGVSSYSLIATNSYNIIRLSKDGTKLETDNHATVRLQEARILLNRLESNKDIIGLRLGHYTVLEKNEEYLKIGCHKFEWSELEALKEICK